MNKKLLCMALFGSLFAKSYASKRFLQSPEVDEDFITSAIDSLPGLDLDGSNSIPLAFWPSEEASMEFNLEDNGELANVTESAENAEDAGEGFGEAGGEDMIFSIEADQDFSLLSTLTQIEKIAMPALAVTSLTRNPTVGTSVGAILALGELVNEASSLGATTDNAVLASTVGSIADAAIGISGNTGANLVNNLGANAIGNLVKDLLNSGQNLPEITTNIPQDINVSDALNALEEIAGTDFTENGEAMNQLENTLQTLSNETGLTPQEIIAAANEIVKNSDNTVDAVKVEGDSLLGNLGEAVGEVLDGTGDVAEHIFDEVKDAVEDIRENVDDVKDGLKDKMKEAVGKFRNIFRKH